MRLFSAATPARRVLAVLVALVAAGRGVRCQGTPWDATPSAEAFVEEFQSELARELPLMGPDQLSRLRSARQEMDTLERSLRQGKHGRAQRRQALNRAFAESAAEIAMSEEGGGSVQHRLAAVGRGVERAAERALGDDERRAAFVDEITEMIKMFAHVPTATG